MDKNTIIAKVAQEPEDRLLLAKIWDKHSQMERRGVPASTGFLSPREQHLAEAMLRTAGICSGYAFDGGYGEAERKVLSFLPDWAEDGGELILLAPGVRAFGENEEMDQMTRRYGYTGRDRILELYRQGAFEGRLMSAAHLIQGSSDGRFTITYATRPENLSREAVEGVGYRWADYEETARRYNPMTLREGWNTLPDGEEIYFVGTPALGLWKAE